MTDEKKKKNKKDEPNLLREKLKYISPFLKEVQYRMAKCYICEKGTVFGNNVSHSVRRTSRNWKPNIKKIKAIVDGSPKSVYVCTRCLRSNKVTRAV